eukprot:1153103-Pyramimonas_sp.AAC.1
MQGQPLESGLGVGVVHLLIVRAPVALQHPLGDPARQLVARVPLLGGSETGVPQVVVGVRRQRG